MQPDDTTHPQISSPRSPSARVPRARSELIRDTVLAGAITGALDATFAVALYVFVLRERSVLGVLQFIASGLLGAAAFQGGLAASLLGVAIHFFLACAFAGLYLTASRGMAFLQKHPIASGLAYGAAVYFFMNFVVLPLTAVPRSPVRAVELVPMLLDHMFFVGLPTALIAARRGHGARVLSSSPA